MNKHTDYSSCSICPQNCNANRFIDISSAFCQTSVYPEIASICKHTGEEPVFGGKDGVCNVFFSHCNLQCIYCQNYQISKNTISQKPPMRLEDAVSRIIKILDSGISFLGFVSPTHQIKQMVEIIELLHKENYFPTILYNTNGYEKINTLKQIEKHIDIYLPDFKYFDNHIAIQYSSAPHYKEITTNAIKEMICQKGIVPKFDKNGFMRQGVVVRHLILPNHIENSINTLTHINNHFGRNLYISIMAQYFPTPLVKTHPKLNRTISTDEYDTVVDTIDNLGFFNGWIQDLDNNTQYKPDFERENPFL